MQKDEPTQEGRKQPGTGYFHCKRRLRKISWLDSILGSHTSENAIYVSLSNMDAAATAAPVDEDLKINVAKIEL